MGCDIHLYVEKRGEDGTWVAADKWVKNPEYESDPEYESEYVVDWKDLLYSDRNYSLFAVLAGVRNSYGIDPIYEPRGLPTDVTELVKAKSDRWGIDGHSHSYLTLAELETHMGGAMILHHEGVVDWQGYMQWKELGFPYMYSKSVAGPKMHITTNKGMEDAIEWGFNKNGAYTVVKWDSPASEDMGSFATETLPKLRQMSDGKPEDIRIVFWFDN